MINYVYTHRCISDVIGDMSATVVKELWLRRLPDHQVSDNVTRGILHVIDESHVSCRLSMSLTWRQPIHQTGKLSSRGYALAIVPRSKVKQPLWTTGSENQYCTSQEYIVASWTQMIRNASFLSERCVYEQHCIQALTILWATWAVRILLTAASSVRWSKGRCERPMTLLSKCGAITVRRGKTA
jgi:hypothetical protein